MNTNAYLDTPIWYDGKLVSNFVPKGAKCNYLQVPKLATIDNLKKALLNALNSPIGTVQLRILINERYQRGNIIIILIDDNTRPNIHTRALLPLLEEELLNYGVNKEDIRILIATGTHTPPTPQQIQDNILRNLYNSWKDRLWIHNCDDLENHEDLGFSKLNTPILIDKRVFSSKLIIPLSDSEYHYFAGIAGSVKLFVPGVSARKTVRVNHSRIFDLNIGFKKECQMKNIEGNVSIQDIREIVTIIMDKYNKKIFVIDAIMQKGQFINIFAGNPISIHNNAFDALAQVRDVKIKEKADLVILAKPSVNFYQAGKGLNAASHAVKQGGQIILLVECKEGVGSDDYLETMKKVQKLSHLEAMRWVINNKCTETNFEIGIQNAVDLFRVLRMTNGKVYIYSEMESKLLTDVFQVRVLNKKEDPQLALRNFINEVLRKKANTSIIIFEDYNLLAIE